MSQAETLKSELIGILKNLAPHFEGADSLIEALEAGVDIELMQELARLLESAAETADEDVRAKMLASAMDVVRERREAENKERSAELAIAEDRIDIDFP